MPGLVIQGGVAVGNDVVDLGDPVITRHYQRPRFVERVLCEEERERLRIARDPHRLLWCLFAAKEAAYKVVSRCLGEPPPFAHRKYRVAPGLDRVHVIDHSLVLNLTVTCSDEWAHAVAATPGKTALAGVEEVGIGVDPSAAARAVLCLALADRLGCAASDLEVVRPPRARSWDGFGPPCLLRRGVGAPVDISLSHDGRWVGFAAALETT
ncbi:MAG: 4'-phosphopantetheinyl transferase superfamily protein [Deltaproteobacteria bacterium]|nr:4'-phosphopantetheinyl transferase superfamily protein [Deltaproteobacteria bacterium]